MALLPGVCRAFHDAGRLRALACIHVDDTRYCGNETSASIWEGLHAKLKFGALRKATEEEVKFLRKVGKTMSHYVRVHLQHGSLRREALQDEA